MAALAPRSLTASPLLGSLVGAGERWCALVGVEQLQSGKKEKRQGHEWDGGPSSRQPTPRQAGARRPNASHGGDMPHQQKHPHTCQQKGRCLGAQRLLHVLAQPLHGSALH